MKNILILAFLALHMLCAEAQNKYHTGSVNHTNFRSEPSFLQEIEMGNIDYERANACLFFATNEQRAKYNKPVGKYMEAMESAAWEHSRSMVEQDFFSHVNPKDPQRRDVADRLKLVGLGGYFGAENIAGNFGAGKTYLQLADALIGMWLNSPGHRAGMLTDGQPYIGTGIYLNPLDLGCKATQVFASGNLQVKPDEVVDHYSNIRKAGKYAVNIADEHFMFANGGSMRKVDILGDVFWQECDQNKKPIFAFTELRRTATHIFLQKKGTDMYARLALGAGAFQIAYTPNPKESAWTSLTGSQYYAGANNDPEPEPEQPDVSDPGVVVVQDPEVKESYTTENGTVFQKIVSSNSEVWQEVNAQGKVVFTFKEYQRDPDRVYILKDGTNMVLSIPRSGSGFVQIGYQDKPGIWGNLYMLKAR
jgi:uncharacterized protein YkwD